MQSHRTRLLLATVCAVVIASALFTPTHLGLPDLGRALNIIDDQVGQSPASTNDNEISVNSTQAGGAPTPPGVAPTPPPNLQQPEEETQRQKIESPTDTSIPIPPLFEPPMSTSSTTLTTIPFGCSVRVIQTNSVMPIFYRVEISAEVGRPVFAKISHDDEVEVFDVVIIKNRGSVLIKSFSRKIPTVEVFSTDSDMKTQLGCRT